MNKIHKKNSIKEQKVFNLIKKHIKKVLSESYMSARYGEITEKLYDIIENNLNDNYLNFLEIVSDVIEDYDIEISKKIKNIIK